MPKTVPLRATKRDRDFAYVMDGQCSDRLERVVEFRRETQRAAQNKAIRILTELLGNFRSGDLCSDDFGEAINCLRDVP